MATVEHFTRALSADYFTEKELTSLIGCSSDKWHVTILKEMIDNSLDAAETVTQAPVIDIKIEYDGTLTVTDNGPGLPEQVVNGSLDFESFISDKNGKVAPTRGQLGNALKCLFAVPLVADGMAHAEINSQALLHDIKITFDQLTGNPIITRETKEVEVYSGCFFKIHEFFKSRLEKTENGKKWVEYTGNDIEKAVEIFSLINPHAEFHLDLAGSERTFWGTQYINKWTADKPLIPHWHSKQQVKNLLQLTFNNLGNIPINKFLSQFNGFKQSSKQKAVCDGINRSSSLGIEAILNDDGVLSVMLHTMKDLSRPIKPGVLGGLVFEHVRKYWYEEKFEIFHKKATGYTTEERPFTLDVFVQQMTEPSYGDPTIGLNNSVLIDGDISDLDHVLDDVKIDWSDPIRVLIHICTPYVEFHTKGKNSISLDPNIFTALEKKLTAAAKSWTKLKKKKLKGEKASVKEKTADVKIQSVVPLPSDADGLKAFADTLKQIQETIDFKAGARGWCYMLEDAIKLNKSDFSKAMDRISLCRKNGLLPWDFTAADSNREMICGDHSIDKRSPDVFFDDLILSMQSKHSEYHPVNLHDFIDVSIAVAVEKIELVELFRPICELYHVPLFNTKGWSDINSRCKLLLYFKEMEQQGKQCRLLYCGDHDPGGLNISGTLKDNLKQLEQAVGFSSDFVHVERFGLNYDFIQEHGLSWIENLDTSNSKTSSLDDPEHADHMKTYVQDYIKKYGVRKCEANALVVKHEAGRQLLTDTILKYIDLEQILEYEQALALEQEKVKALLMAKFAA